MRSLLLAGLLALMLTASASAQTDILLEARGVPGGSVVDINDLPDPFILDVIIISDQPMSGFSIQIGGTGHYLAMTDFYGMASYNYADIIGPPPTNSSNWSTAMTDVIQLGENDLPMTGADAGGDELGTIFGDALATSGLACWLEITNYQVGTIPVTKGSVGDANGMPIPNVGLGELVITPEPASVMLLLLGVPFLRRRR
jgi:hypothetical protein